MRFSEATAQMVNEGFSVNVTDDPQIGLRNSGFNPVTRRMSALHEARLDQAMQMWLDFKEGRVNPVLMKEAFCPSDSDLYAVLNRRYPMVFNESITTSDFDFLTDNMMNRLLMAAESPMPTTWKQIVRQNNNIRDFRQLTRYGVDGGMGVFLPVAEREGFDRMKVARTKYNYSVAKFELGFDMSWETVINDDLGALSDMPQRLLIGGDMTVEKFVTQLYVDANGPNASFFSVGNGNILTGNPVLSQDALEKAVAKYLGFQDVDGIPIMASGAILVVSSGADYVKATNWKNTLVTRMTTSLGAAGREMEVRNWLAEKFDVMYNPWIPKIATTANGSTSWFIFQRPEMGRPAIELGFLNGFSKPTLYRKASNTLSLGGGDVAGMGDFETMATEYKGLIVFGGTTIYPKAAISSNGSGA
jgi:hypothetical protein